MKGVLLAFVVSEARHARANGKHMSLVYEQIRPLRN